MCVSSSPQSSLMTPRAHGISVDPHQDETSLPHAEQVSPSEGRCYSQRSVRLEQSQTAATQERRKVQRFQRLLVSKGGGPSTSAAASAAGPVTDDRSKSLFLFR